MRRRSDAFYVYAARAARGFGDGFAIIILPAYLTEIGFDPFQVGIIATAALLGTAITTLAAGFLAAHYDLRNLLLLTAVVMLATGIAIPTFEQLVLLLPIRAALSQMDVPTRTSYVMAVVTPAERPAAAGITAVPRSLALSVSPAMAGAMLGTAFSGLPFVICGGLKIVYDLALLFGFRHIRPPEEEAKN